MEKYYFKTDGDEFKPTCTEPCNAADGGANFGVFIGSIACSQCEHFKGGNRDEKYIICDIIEQATGKER